MFIYSYVFGIHNAAGLELVEALDQLIVLLLVEVQLYKHINYCHDKSMVYYTYLLSDVFVALLVSRQ